MQGRHVISFVVAFLLMAGCDPLGVLKGSEEGPPSDFSGQYIQTSQDTYQWNGESLTIEYEYKNPFDQRVFTTGCVDGRGPAHIIERRSGDDWERVYGRACLSIGGVTPTSIASEGTYEATFELNETSRWDGPVSGTYRFREPMSWTWVEEKHREGTLETGTWTSNEFEIQ